MKNIVKLSLVAVMAILLVLTSAISAMGLTTEQTVLVSNDGVAPSADPYEPDDNFDTVYYFSDNLQSRTYRQSLLQSGAVDRCDLYYYDPTVFVSKIIDLYEHDRNEIFSSQDCYVIFEIMSSFTIQIDNDDGDLFTDYLYNIFSRFHENGCKIMFICGVDENQYMGYRDFLSYVDVHINSGIYYDFIANIFYRAMRNSTGNPFDNATFILDASLSPNAENGHISTSFIVSYFIPFIRSIFIDELLYTTNTNADVMDLHQIKLICHIYNTTFYNVMTNEYIYWDDDLLSNGEFASAIENDHIYAIGTTWNGASEAESWLQMMQESKKNCSKSFSIFLYNTDGYAISDNVSSDVYVAGPVTGIYEVILAFVSGQDMRPFKNWSGLCEITHKPMNFSIYGWMVDLTGVFIVDGWQVITPPAAYAYYRCDNNDVDPKSTI